MFHNICLRFQCLLLSGRRTFENLTCRSANVPETDIELYEFWGVSGTNLTISNRFDLYRKDRVPSSCKRLKDAATASRSGHNGKLSALARDPVHREPLPASFCLLLHDCLEPRAAVRTKNDLINAFVSPRPTPNLVLVACRDCRIWTGPNDDGLRSNRPNRLCLSAFHLPRKQGRCTTWW